MNVQRPQNDIVEILDMHQMIHQRSVDRCGH